MNKSLKILALLFAGLLVLSFVVGCSSEKSTQENQEGNTNDPEYQAAQTEAVTQVEYSIDNMASGMTYISGFVPPESSFTTTDTSYYGYDDISGWWYFYANGDSANFSATTADSIRFTAGETHQENPDSTTDKMEFRLYLNLYASDTSGSASMDYLNDWTYTGLNTDTLQINGNGSYEWAMAVNDHNYYVNMSEQFDSIRWVIGSLYPFAGVLSLSMTANYLDENYAGQITDWDFTITFYEDHYHAYASNGTYYWEWDFYYGT